MSKLWEKESKVDKKIEKFTVGNDYILDQELIRYDCLGSIAHCRMLGKTVSYTHLRAHET